MPTILLVDDEPDILTTLEMAITRGLPGVRVLTAKSATEGLAALDREPVDLVCSDYKMPGMTGLDFLVEARKRAPHVARLLLTAFPDDEMAVRAINEARLDHFFVKPVRLAEVVARFREILDDAARRGQADKAIARSIDALRQDRVGARHYPAPFAGPLTGGAAGGRSDE